MEKLNNNRIEEVQTPEDSNYPEAPNFDILTSDDTVKTPETPETPETLDHETLVNNVKEKFNTSRIKQEVFRTLCAFTSGMALSMLIFAQKDVQPLDKDYQEIVEQTNEEIDDEQGESEASERLRYTIRETRRINAENRAKADEIIKELDLKESDDFLVQLQNCLKVYNYIVRENVFYPDISKEISDDSPGGYAPNIIHKALHEGRGDAVSYCYEFQYILNRLNMQVARVILEVQSPANDKKLYMSNVVKLQDKYYFFDTILEQNAMTKVNTSEKGSYIDQNTTFIAAGIGSKTYEDVVSATYGEHSAFSLNKAYFDTYSNIDSSEFVARSISNEDLSLGTLIDLDSINRHVNN